MSINNFYDIVIIGGGASGMMCSALIAKENKNVSVALVEKLDRVGKKLLLTGNGRCNLTNLNMSEDKYHGTFMDGVKNAISELTPEKLIEIFDSLGLITSADSEGRVYPNSRLANSVLDVLRIACRKSCVDIITNSEVLAINRNNDIFSVICNDKTIRCKKLVISAGSRSGIKSCDGSNMYEVLKNLGHSTTPLYPALCPVKVKSDKLKSLKGIRALGKVSILKDKEVLMSEYGEIQFAENYLSGICVFNLSFIANSVKDTYLSLDLLPDISKHELYTRLQDKKKMYARDSRAEELPLGYFSKMLGIALLKESGISLSKSVADITDKELLSLADSIKDWRFEVVPHTDLAKSQVTAGGIKGDEVDSLTMMSKKCSDLYIIGEMLDCNGDCGGYNLHFAFASAYCAARDILKRI